MITKNLELPKIENSLHLTLSLPLSHSYICISFSLSLFRSRFSCFHSCLSTSPSHLVLTKQGKIKQNRLVHNTVHRKSTNLLMAAEREAPQISAFQTRKSLTHDKDKFSIKQADYLLHCGTNFLVVPLSQVCLLYYVPRMFLLSTNKAIVSVMRAETRIELSRIFPELIRKRGWIEKRTSGICMQIVV